MRKKHNLPIQFDIKVLGEEYATLEFMRLPPYASNIDGVTLNLKKVDKPQVFINSSQPQKRLQFTLAHELGHIIIPWHTGNIVENFSDINIETSSTAEWFRLINKSNFSGVETKMSISESLVKKAFSVGSISMADEVFSMTKFRDSKSDFKSKYT